MKRLLFLFLYFFPCVAAHAQMATFATITDGQNTSVFQCRYPAAAAPHYKRHCWAARSGRTSVIVGASMAVVGAIFFYAASRAETNNPNNEYAGDGYFYAGAVFGGLGIYATGVGGCLYLGGKIYEARHRNRYSLNVPKNGLGIACNF